MKLILMFVLFCDITIGNYRFRQCNEVRIEKSWRELGDKCTIKLPKTVRTDSLKTSTLEDYIKVGDLVTVKLRYQDLVQHTEFEGRVSRIKPNIPFEIECEDTIWYFKKTPLKKTWKKSDKPTLEMVAKYLVDEVNKKYPIANVKLMEDLPEVNFSENGFLIESGNTAATVIQKLKEEYGLISYFKANELFVGLAYQKTYGRVLHSLAWNVIDSDLTYRTQDDTLIRIKGIGVKSDNTKIEPKKIVGDPEGQLRTVFYYDVTSEAQVLKLANNDLTKFKYSGYEGTFNTFLYPYAEPLMITDLKGRVFFNKDTGHYQYDESMSGSYIIDSVITTFGHNGARREIEAGVKLSV